MSKSPRSVEPFELLSVTAKILETSIEGVKSIVVTVKSSKVFPSVSSPLSLLSETKFP